MVLFEESNSLRKILRTMSEMIEPSINLFVVTFLIFYVFALWGMYMFGGIIKRDSEVTQLD